MQASISSLGRLLAQLTLAALTLAPAGRAQPSWRLHSPPPGPDLASDDRCALAYDSSRGRTVLFVRNETWEWDGSQWSPRFPASTPSVAPGASLAYDSARARTVLYGVDSTTLFSATWEWDGTTWVQRFPATSPTPRLDTTLAYDSGRGRTVLFGGRQVGLFILYDDTWEWDGTDWLAIMPSTRPAARSLHGMAYDVARGRVVLFGGCCAYQDTWEWDGTSWTRIVVDSSPQPTRLWATALAYDSARQRTVLFGGLNFRGEPTADTWEWDGTSWTLMVTAVHPWPRGNYGLAYDSGRGRLVLIGGPTFDTWERDGTNWIERIPLGPPGPQPSIQAVAFDTARQRMVLFDGSALNATYEWDGVRWRWIGSLDYPEVSSYAMAFDSTRSTTLLVGISTHPPVAHETWGWNGLGWGRLGGAFSPRRTSGFALAHDAARGQMVLFGGLYDIPPNTRSAETWLWNGSSWGSVLPNSSPPPRSSHAMAYDAALQQVVLFGGFDGAQDLDDTWVWDGTNWTEAFPPTRPLPRNQHAMAYDTARARILLFGGHDATREFDDLWEWNGATWSEISTVTRPSSRYACSLVDDPFNNRAVLFGGFHSGSRLNDIWELGLYPTLISIRPSTGAESGGDLVGLDGINFTTAQDTTVTIGGTVADVVRMLPDRVTVRTPPGSGLVDVSLTNSNGSTTLPLAFTYLDSTLVARYGTVNVALGDRDDVLLVNNGRGDSLRREVTVRVGQPIRVVMARPSNRSGESPFVLYGWPLVPDASTRTPVPQLFGSFVIPPPFRRGQPAAIWNNLGYGAVLGRPTLPSSPAPSIVFRRASGAPHPVTVTMQGLIEDDGSAIPQGISITNAVILRVQP